MTAATRVKPSHPAIKKRIDPHIKIVIYALLVIEGTRLDPLPALTEDQQRFVPCAEDVLDRYGEDWHVRYRPAFNKAMAYYASRTVGQLEDLLDNTFIHAAFEVLGWSDEQIEAFPEIKWADYREIVEAFGMFNESREDRNNRWKRLANALPGTLIEGLRLET
jgi:hypothetical protein